VVGGDSARARLLRQAISIAIDMEEYVAIFQNGRGQPAHGPLPPGIFGYREGLGGINPVVYEIEGQRIQRRGTEEARALLAQAGYAGGRDPQTGAPLVLYYDTAASGPESKALMDWYRRQFDKLGIELVIRGTDYNRFQEKMFKGNAQIYTWGWNADYPDPENFFFLLYGPNGKVEHKGENASNYANAAYDALFDRMKGLPNGPERRAVIDRMLEILRRDAPWVWGFYPKAFGLHHAWYRNTKPHLMANNTLKYRRIDAEQRARLRQAWNAPVTWPLYLIGGLLAVSAIPAWISVRRRERRAAR
jgi:ABC-type transport system substrate-binding protein